MNYGKLFYKAKKEQIKKQKLIYKIIWKKGKKNLFKSEEDMRDTTRLLFSLDIIDIKKYIRNKK